MAVRPILTVRQHESELRKKSSAVGQVNDKVRALVTDLWDTLHAAPGSGLAAPQIGVHKRVVVVILGIKEEDVKKRQELTLINPVILHSQGLHKDFDACLSIPGLQGYTRRPIQLEVKALGLNGKPFTRTFKDWDARVVAHEIDHLDGILFTERLESLSDLYWVVRDNSGNAKLVPYNEGSPIKSEA